ncbi:MAG: nucleotidyltransferase [Candidatus Omnitrophica bacterium CG23_combo_of_CG06-09_8_20_14_all_41_10]|uniref:Nucleotidyltransferase n=1 Tax=Candidatus Sherwoodlollariibacterium unditelluris TaxID=1974757 RepID=A0A2G9YK65_9BACT|nr:MAG: nucleotidyltransferase [Candidatus Omnitrophica bacterium CG23_combo_of_CG06-09_8_20_14_all_41_10]
MKIQEAVKDYFSGQKDVVSVYLFGSTATGKTHSTSDVDIAVFFQSSLPQEEQSSRSLLMMDELSRILDKNIDIVVLNSANSFLKFQIIKSGLRLCEDKERKSRGFEARAIMEYFDFLPIRNRLEEALVNNIKEGA